MNIETRFKDSDWVIPNKNGSAESWDAVKIALLMHLRDELKTIKISLNRNRELLTEIRGLRRDLKERLKPRCHMAHIKKSKEESR